MEGSEVEELLYLKVEDLTSEFPNLKLGTARRIVHDIKSSIPAETDERPEESRLSSSSGSLTDLLKDSEVQMYDIRTKCNAMAEFRGLIKFAELNAETQIDEISPDIKSSISAETDERPEESDYQAAVAV
jgi:hypothetical protein